MTTTGKTKSEGTIKLIECPRDAMQGIKKLIPTRQKIKYINTLLEVGFDTLDCGSFVSPKAIPQMADTAEVIHQLKTTGSRTKLLVIVANVRGAQDAIQFEKINCLGFPFSISPTFQKRNINSTIEESLERLGAVQSLCTKYNKELVVYLSMGFGNPYGDPFDDNTLLTWAEKMVNNNVKIISLADTVGVATPRQIKFALETLKPAYRDIEIGVHLHSTFQERELKLEAAIIGGCTRFDGAIKGFGGCPMAKDELTGNIASEWMIDYFQKENLMSLINRDALQRSLKLAEEIFIR